MLDEAARAGSVEATERPHRPLLSLMIAIFAFGLLLVGQLDAINFTVDDTFVSLRYAENAAAGRGLVYNAGERIEGYSNLLWTLLLTAAAKSGFTQERSELALLVFAKIGGFVLGVLTFAVLSLGVFRIARRQPWGRSSGLLALALLGTSATYSFSLWNLSGLETPLAAFLVTAAVVSTFEVLQSFDDSGRASRGWLTVAGIAFGMLTLVRPEQVFITLLALGASWFLAPARLRSVILAVALPSLLAFVALELWRWSYYHALLPNSVVSKSGGGMIGQIIGVKYALAGFLASIGCVALGLLALPRLLAKGTAWKFLAVYCAAYAVFLFVSGGDWMPGFRFHAPLFPAFWLLAIASLLTLVREAAGWVSDAVLALVTGILMLGTFSEGRAFVRAQSEFPTGLRQVTWNSAPSRIALAKELSRIVPEGCLLGIFEAGCIPYFDPQLRILDDSGLMDPVIARLPGRHMFKFSIDYFFRRRPDFFLTMVKAGVPSTDAAQLLASVRFGHEYERMRVFRSEDLRRATPGVAQAEDDLTFVLYRHRP